MAADKKTSRKKPSLSAGERRRLRQLMICLILFATVFLGRGIDLGPVTRLSTTVGQLVRMDTDFQAVFSHVGESFSNGEPAVETFRSLWSGLMDPESATPETESGTSDSGEPVPAPQPTQEGIDAQIA